jgi:hypothetical protein
MFFGCACRLHLLTIYRSKQKQTIDAAMPQKGHFVVVPAGAQQNITMTMRVRILTANRNVENSLHN